MTMQSLVTSWYASAQANESFDPSVFVQSLASAADSTSASSRAFAEQLDHEDPLIELRKEYALPQMGPIRAYPATLPEQSDQWVAKAWSAEDRLTAEALLPTSATQTTRYFCGNSLGPLPLTVRERINRELDIWAERGVNGHFDHPDNAPWATMFDPPRTLLADLVGAQREEVAIMGTLTQNLLNLLATFYRPLTHPAGLETLLTPEVAQQVPSGKRRHKIVYEARAFPSDQYALQSAVLLAGFNPVESLVALTPREGEVTLRTEDVLAKLDLLGKEDETALVLLPAVQYSTGQFFDMLAITQRAKQHGMIVGWDCAHGFLNVPMRLHEWGVDFACWCTYKYGSAGPGAIAGLFVHRRWHALAADPTQLPRPAGWFGHNLASRFAMPDKYVPEVGAAGWVVSNPSVIDCAALQGALEVVAKAPGLAKAESSAVSPDNPGAGQIMPILRARSLRLTAYLEWLLSDPASPAVLPKQAGAHLVTPTNPQERGAQLCIRIPEPADSAVARTTAAKTASNAVGDAPPPPIDSRSLAARTLHTAEHTFGLVGDTRAPDIVRIAPLAQYTTWQETWDAANALALALRLELARPMQ